MTSRKSRAKETKVVTDAEPEVIESETAAGSATSERSSSKLRHHAKLFRTTLDSIQVFWQDASKEAKAEAYADLIEAAQDLDGFLQD